MKAIISRGNSATSFIARNIAANGWRALHGVEHSRFDDQLFKLNSLIQVRPHLAISVSQRLELYLNELRAVMGDTRDVVSVHGYVFYQLAYLNELYRCGTIPLLFIHREPIRQCLSVVRSKLKAPRDGARHLDFDASALIERAPFALQEAEALFVSYYASILDLMRFFSDKPVPRLAFEDLGANLPRMKATLSAFLGRPFTFYTTDVINKQTEGDYLARMRSVLRPVFAAWFDDAILSEHLSLHRCYGYGASLSDVLFSADGVTLSRRVG